jgi:succinate dehydrogenase / fumarate reductase cytochrome b subunit
MNNNQRMYSSLTRKVALALSGLFLVVFLCIHLGVNLLLLRDDGGAAFTAAATFMSTNPFVRPLEIILFTAFLLHMVNSVIVTVINRLSRPVRYLIANRSETSFLSKYMIHLGGIITVFLVLHFIDFYFVKIGLANPPEGVGRHDFYRMSVLLFTNPWYSLTYSLCFLALGFHLNHAVQSAFQTMGLNHSKYTMAIKAFSTTYAVLIAGGFMTIPLWFIFFR